MMNSLGTQQHTSIISFLLHMTNYPKTQQLNKINIYYCILFWWVINPGVAVWIWLRLELQSSESLTEDLLPRWFTQMPGRLVLVVGRRSQLPFMWIPLQSCSHVLMTSSQLASCKVSDLRDSKAEAVFVTYSQKSDTFISTVSCSCTRLTLFHMVGHCSRHEYQEVGALEPSQRLATITLLANLALSILPLPRWF